MSFLLKPGGYFFGIIVDPTEVWSASGIPRVLYSTACSLPVHRLQMQKATIGQDGSRIHVDAQGRQFTFQSDVYSEVCRS